MIGQKKLFRTIDRAIQAGFPAFSIIAGGAGSGKQIAAKYIASQLGAQLIICGAKVDDIRDIIELSYKQMQSTVYLIPNTDRMSIAAKNALLKITEEAPANSYFILTLTDASTTLATLRSRALVLNMDPYSRLDLIEYVTEIGYNLSKEEMEVVLGVCQLPGEIDRLVRYDILAFYSYIEKVTISIGLASGVNALKIGGKLSYKDVDAGWDIVLFLRAVMLVFRRLMDSGDPNLCKESIRCTSRYLSEIQATAGINKSASIDMWILELRSIWI